SDSHAGMAASHGSIFAASDGCRHLGVSGCYRGRRGRTGVVPALAFISFPGHHRPRVHVFPMGYPAAGSWLPGHLLRTVEILAPSVGGTAFGGSRVAVPLAGVPRVFLVGPRQIGKPRSRLAKLDRPELSLSNPAASQSYFLVYVSISAVVS